MRSQRGGRVLAVTVGLVAAGAVVPPPRVAASPSAPDVAGPRSRDAVAGTPVASTFGELSALVGDPKGPPEIELAPVTFRGDLIVKRPVTLRGQRDTVLEGTGRSTVLTIDANDVNLENVAIRHSGRRSTTEDAAIRATGDRVRISNVRVDDSLFGISLLACHQCVLEHAEIQGVGDEAELRGDGIKLWESHDSIVRGCVVDHVRDIVVWYTRRAIVEDNVVHRSRYGTHFMYAHDSIARRNRLEHNVVGIFVMYSFRVAIEDNVLAGAKGPAGMGVGFKESDAASVRGNRIVANTTGTYLDFTPRTPETGAVFERNVFALNGVAVRLHGIERGPRFHANDFRDNDEVVGVDGGGSALGCDIQGNHFTDYQGYDLNGDGVGDVPYRVNALSNELSDEHPALKFFHGTAAMSLVDALARAFPIFEARPVLVDPAPLVRSPEAARP